MLVGCARAGVLLDDGGAQDAVRSDGASTGGGGPGTEVDAGPDAQPRVDASTDMDASMEAGSGDAATTDGGAAMPDAADADAQVDAAAPDGDAGAVDAGSDAAEDGDTGSPCVPGTYAGTFEGEISFGLIGLEIEGDLEIVVMSDSTGATLRIDEGYILGKDQDGNPMEAEVEGAMDCTTFELQGGRLTNGVYTREAFNWPVNFEGSVEATYHPGDVPSVMGTWATEGSIESGRGTFQAALTQPAP